MQPCVDVRARNCVSTWVTRARQPLETRQIGVQHPVGPGKLQLALSPSRTCSRGFPNVGPDHWRSCVASNGHEPWARRRGWRLRRWLGAGRGRRRRQTALQRARGDACRARPDPAMLASLPEWPAARRAETISHRTAIFMTQPVTCSASAMPSSTCFDCRRLPGRRAPRRRCG
jgi:hypothetical protein